MQTDPFSCSKSVKIVVSFVVIKWLKVPILGHWREGVGIEPTKRRSTAPPIGFEARGAHQSHIPPAKG